MASLRGTVLLVLLVLLGAGCGKSKDSLGTESRRLWGSALEAARWKEAANTAIAVSKLHQRRAELQRVLSMPFQEVVARLGFVRYTGAAKVIVDRAGHHIELLEDTSIEHGQSGDWRVVQNDAEGNVQRELIHSNGMYFFRNGPGKLRRHGSADIPGAKTREEAFRPLKTFTEAFGDQLELEPMGKTTIGGLSAAKYAFVLGAKAGLVQDPNHPKRRLRPERISGFIAVALESGVALQVSLRGTLGIEPPAGSESWGKLQFLLDAGVEPIEGRPILVEDFLPPIVHRRVDLNPLGFLEGETRTSTTIGGK